MATSQPEKATQAYIREIYSDTKLSSEEKCRKIQVCIIEIFHGSVLSGTFMKNDNHLIILTMFNQLAHFHSLPCNSYLLFFRKSC